MRLGRPTGSWKRSAICFSRSLLHRSALPTNGPPGRWGHQGQAIGTLLVAPTLKTQARKQWMVDHLQLRGSVTIDDGALAKLNLEGKSLLPIGMTAVQGDFSRGDVIAIRAADGREIARGLANYASAEARLLCRKPSTDIEALLGYVAEPEMVHRDNLVLLALGA